MKLANKILLLSLTLAISLILLISSFYTFYSFKSQDYSIQTLKNKMYDDYDFAIKTQVHTVISFLKYIQSQVDAKKITKEAAQKQAADVIRQLRYGKDGYFWVDTSEGINVVLLGKDTEGKSRINFLDIKGKPIIQEFIRVSKNAEGGFVDYFFPKAGQTEPLPKRGFAFYFPSFDWVVGTGNYINDIDSQILVVKNKANQELLFWLTFSLVLAAVLALLGAGITFFVVKRIVRPFQSISKALEAISKGNGDLTLRLNIISKDEAGLVAQGFNGFTQYLHSMIKDLVEISGHLKDVGVELSSNTAETATAVRQITATTETAENQINKQRAQVAETASAVEQVSANIESLNTQIQDQASALDSMVQRLDRVIHNIELLEQGAQKVNQENGRLKTLSQNGQYNLSLVTEQLDGVTVEAQKLQEANAFIQEIASQTGLLAMNAAIEAAHAGEAGKGFSVVADEIGKLAENSAAQSKIISQGILSVTTLLEGVLSQARVTQSEYQTILSAVQTIGVSLEESERINREQNIEGAALKDQLLSLHQVTQSVTSSSAEMTTANSDILNAVKNLKEITLTIGQAIKEVTQGNNEINQAVENINELGLKNKNQTDSLDEHLKKFKI